MSTPPALRTSPRRSWVRPALYAPQLTLLCLHTLRALAAPGRALGDPLRTSHSALLSGGGRCSSRHGDTDAPHVPGPGWVGTCLVPSTATEEKGARGRQAAPSARGAAGLLLGSERARSGGAARRVRFRVGGPAGESHGAGRAGSARRGGRCDSVDRGPGGPGPGRGSAGQSALSARPEPGCFASRWSWRRRCPGVPPDWPVRLRSSRCLRSHYISPQHTHRKRDTTRLRSKRNVLQGPA